jgi:hypothetical protein
MLHCLKICHIAFSIGQLFKKGVAAVQIAACSKIKSGYKPRIVHLDSNVARFLYGVVLKGIGLPMEEALHFWRQEFAPRTKPEAFNKEYAYNIRHIYGKEGARKNYTPYSCIKMITSAVSTVRPLVTSITQRLQRSIYGALLFEADICRTVDRSLAS